MNSPRIEIFPDIPKMYYLSVSMALEKLPEKIKGGKRKNNM